MAAFRQSLEKERTAHLREARDLLQQCARLTCGKTLRTQCLTRYNRIDADIPSVVPVVTDRDGTPRVDVEVTLDGQPFTSRLDGSAISVDPGVHEFSFHQDGDVVARQKVMIVQGQRNRPIPVSLQGTERAAAHLQLAAGTPAPVAAEGRTRLAASPTAAASPVIPPQSVAPALTGREDSPGTESQGREEAKTGDGADTDPAIQTAAASDDVPAAAKHSVLQPTGRRSMLPYLITAVGVAGVAGFGLGTYWGRQDNDQLGRCTPNCQPGSLEHIRRIYLAADVSLGVGIAALGTAAILWATSARRAPEETTVARAPAALRLGVRTTVAGTFADLSGSF